MTSDYFSPDNVLVVTFGEDPKQDENAYQALTDLKQLDSQDQIKITGAAVVTRDGEGRVDVKSDVGEDPLVGTASGGVIGLLIGIIGGPLGMLIGGAYGMLVGSLFDIDEVDTTESVLGEISKQVQPTQDGGPRSGHRAEPRGHRRRDGAPRWRGPAPAGGRRRGGDRRGRGGAAEGRAGGSQGAAEGSRREDQGRRTRQGRGDEGEAPSVQGRRERVGSSTAGGGALNPGAPPL